MAEIILDYYQNETEYSDGAKVEDEIMGFVKNNPSINTENLRNMGWPAFYHLSPLRENILNWYPFKKDCTILEIGAGCGAITGLLCRKAKRVTAVELTEKRARINFERHKSCQNLKIFVGNLENMRFDEQFDYVIINGVLEYAAQFISDDDPYYRFLNLASSFLAADGKILLAIENRLGMKYFAGAKEDHTGQYFTGLNNYRHHKIKTFSRGELTDLIQKSGLHINEFYYPFPDYKLPQYIYTDKGFSMVPLDYDMHSFDSDRYLLFDEVQMQNTLLKENANGIFANSFLVEIAKNVEKPKQSICYVKINSNRHPKFQIFTMIYQDGDKIKVRKQALTKEAKSHLKKMIQHYKNSSKDSNFSLLPLKEEHDGVVYDYCKGSTVENLLLDASNHENEDLFFEVLDEFYQSLCAFPKTGVNLYEPEYQKCFGTFQCEETLEFFSFHNIDILFGNVFYQQHKFTIIDYEWCLNCDLPILFVFWRSINNFYLNNPECSHFIPAEELYSKYGITEKKIQAFYRWEEWFSSHYVQMTNLQVYQKALLPLSGSLEEFDQNRNVATVYVDSGNGFHQDEKISVHYTLKSKKVDLTFDLGRFSHITHLRFDPLEGKLCKCKILSVMADDVDCGHCAYNSFPFYKESDLFLTVDPVYHITGDWKGKSKLHIQFEIEFLESKDIFPLIFDCIQQELSARNTAESKIQQAAEQYELLNRQFTELEDSKEKCEQQLELTHNQIAELEDAKEKCEQELELSRNHIAELEDAKQKCLRDLDSLHEQITQLESENSRLLKENEGIKAQRDAVALEYQIILNSACWKMTKPLRVFLDTCKKGKHQAANLLREFAKLAVKTEHNLKTYGVKKTVAKIFKKGGACLSNVKESGKIAQQVQSSDVWEQISRWIDETPHSFIDIFHVPMGWDTPLFQRFQHLSLQAGAVGGISFYGAHPLVDKDIKVCKFITPTLCIVNLDNYEVKQKLFEILDAKPGLKFIRLQSIDLATTKEELESFLARGYEIIYEYIDELTPQIVGNIPKFVFERHEYVLKNERITVVATSDKLFDQVKPYRSKNMAMINNGVDYDHWNIKRDDIECPEDLKEIVGQGKIIIGYHGALARWLDYDLLKKLAEDQRFLILLIGYAHDEYLKNSGLLDYENVHFIGPRPYQELNKYAAFYDIAILPFVLNDLTKSVSPVKIFEYMALGKPVVTYALPECLKYRSCLCANTQEEFIEAVHKALELRFDKKYRALLKKEALENTWQSIMKKTVALVQQNHSLYQQENQQAPSAPPVEKTPRRYPQESGAYQALKSVFWHLPFLTPNAKQKFLYSVKKTFCPSLLQYPPQDGSTPAHKLESVRQEISQEIGIAPQEHPIQSAYINQILNIPNKSKDYVPITETPYSRQAKDCKIIAYYLTQFHPDKHNEEWWGKGVTEWNNVCRAVPQFVGHYQPRLPGELGFYDLRIRENMARQIELAKMYGIYGFCFYYYWFDGERLLEKPLEAFLKDKTLDFPFSICWANENWTKRFDGTSFDVLMEQSDTVESYCHVIHDMIRFLKDDRYIEIGGKKVITVYRPDKMPETEKVLNYWREYCRKHGAGELYVMAVKVNQVDLDLLHMGYDAITEFHPGTLYVYCKNITNDIQYVRDDFGGEVFDYRDIVENQKYFQYHLPKLYRAVMPMWDNTARRNNKGMIFHGSTPALYKQWLKDVIYEERSRKDLDDQMVFINAWNEWGEGAYLEPDKRFGYAYLQATKEALEETRGEGDIS
ncbi:MAG: Methyltransferase type 12 [Oscillospiraceae bacterium]